MIKDTVVLQIRKDIILNLNIMEKHIYRDSIKKLEKDELELAALLRTPKTNLNCHYSRAQHALLIKEVQAMDIAMLRLKKMIFRFLLQKKFGVRENPKHISYFFY